MKNSRVANLGEQLHFLSFMKPRERTAKFLRCIPFKVKPLRVQTITKASAILLINDKNVKSPIQILKIPLDQHPKPLVGKI